MKKTCPKCLSPEGIRIIIWGMPSEEPDPKKYFVAGCLVEDKMYKFKCISCKWQGN